MFFIQGITAAIGASVSPDPPLAVTGGVVALIVAAMYLNSAIRAQRHAAPPVPQEL